MVCGGNLTAEVEPQNFSSPLYPQFYPVQTFCEWIIATTSMDQTILLTFEDFRTQECCDFLTVSVICTLFCNNFNSIERSGRQTFLHYGWLKPALILQTGWFFSPILIN